jgi:hypothetical protein
MGGVVLKLKILMTAIGMLGSVACFAAPFCVVVLGFGQDCHYFDEPSCAQAAAAQHGACFVNTGLSLRSPAPNGARYCLALGATQQCNFRDQISCTMAARDSGGTCVPN